MGGAGGRKWSLTTSEDVTEQRIDTKHPDYSEEMWQKCRDFVIGGDRVKSQGRRYLPELSGQSLERYEAYKARAMFYDATSRTMQGLMVRSFGVRLSVRWSFCRWCVEWCVI
jgi:hypothetical protein